MAQNVNVNENVKYAKPKRKHRLTALWITLAIVGVVIVLPISLLYILFYDGTRPTLNTNETTEISEMVNSMLINSISDTKTTKAVSINVTEDGLNQVLYDSMKDADATFRTYFPRLYVDIQDNAYMFALDVNVPLFKTRVLLYTSLDEYEDLSDSSNNAIVFQITNVQVGRIGGLGDFALSLFNGSVSNESIEKIFADAGINLSCDLANKTLTYLNSQMLIDMRNMMGESTYSNLFFSLLYDFFENKLVTFDFYSNNKMNANISLNSMITNENFVTDAYELNLDLDSYRDKTENLIDDNIIDEDHISNLFSYLILGYTNSSNETKAYVDSLDLTSIGISNNQTYVNPKTVKGTDITTVVKNQINPADIALGKIASVTEEDINGVVKAEQIVGFTYPFYQSVDGASTINYMTVDNFYTNIINGKIYFIFGLNINGCETRVILEMTKKEVTNYTLVLENSDVLYGTENVSNTLVNQLFNLIASGVDGESWIVVDTTTHDIKISFQSAIESSGYKSIIDAVGTVDVIISNSTLAEVGKLDIIVS